MNESFFVSPPSAATLSLGVRIRGTLHAIPIPWIAEVLPELPVESIAQAPSFVRGVIFVRGHLIPVLDAGERLGLPPGERPPDPNIVCLQLGGRLVGLEVDECTDLLELPLGGRLAAADVAVEGGPLTSIVELKGEVVRVLDPERLLAPAETAALSGLPRVRSSGSP